MDSETVLLSGAFLITALAYASVGQAGATGYIAIMGFAGFAPLPMKTTALTLNLMVAAIGTVLFLRAGRLSSRHVWPFAVLGVPFSVVGGSVQLPEAVYFPLVGAVLVVSAIQMARTAVFGRAAGSDASRSPPFFAALVTGAVIGFISGTTGTGGGVFLAPVILGMNWGSARQTAATTAIYNLVNSGGALAGAHAAWGHLPPEVPLWLGTVALGGLGGAILGSRYLPDRLLRGILSLLLFLSGLRLIW